MPQCGILRLRQTRGVNAINWLDVNGTALRYELSGGGKTMLVLVHEMGGTLDSWDQVLPVLNNSRRVLRVEPSASPSGTGQSSG